MRIINPEKFNRILEICASQEKVKEEVINNYEDNRWWPQSIKDWRIRFLIAGLSARVSYRMIETYQKVIKELRKYSYEEITSMSKEEFISIIKPLGLMSLRVKFWKSAIEFIEKTKKKKINLKSLSNDELISLIKKEVEGANFHLAQCCALYLKGYHCGIIPVDDGIIKTFAPCLGLPVPKGSYRYEVLRKELEELTQKINCLEIALRTGYQSLNLPKDKPLTWWMHLVLIYYKRIFCNQHNPQSCPLKRRLETKEIIGQVCDKNNPEIGGTIKNIIFEGIDGTGKTTMAEMFSKIGFKKLHARYHPEIEDLYLFYNDLLERDRNQRIVFDRSFISEMVYGPILRGKSRLSMKQFEQLLNKLKNQNTLIVYLHCPLGVLFKRKIDKTISREYYSRLLEGYEKILKVIENFLPVLRINSGELTPEKIFYLIAGVKFPE